MIFIIVKMMLIIFHEGWKAGLFPSGALFHLSHLGPEFRVLCFLMSVPNRVWGAMGDPCHTYLASYNSSGGPSWFYFATCVCWLAPHLFSKQLGPAGHSFPLVQTWKLGGCPHSLGN